MLTITGQYLEPLFADADGHCAVSRALIGGVPCASTRPVDSGTLECVTPPGVGMADVTVRPKPKTLRLQGYLAYKKHPSPLGPP